MDGCAIECLNDYSNSFVHVDYSEPMDNVKTAMKNHFSPLGYELVGLEYIPKEKITPNGFHPTHIPFNEHEKNRLDQYDFIRNAFQHRLFQPYALWAVYELNENKTGSTIGKLPRFSLLHIGGEACATFDALYVSNNINPLGVIIKNAGEGYGNNWTSFRDPEFRLYKLIKKIHAQGQPMPKYLMTNYEFTKNIAFWPDYSFLNETHFYCDSRIYKHNNQN